MSNFCEKCGKIHDGDFGSGRFCSRSCANSRIHTKKSKEKISKKLSGLNKSKVEVICLNCEVKVLTSKSRAKRKKICSNRCKMTYYNKNYNLAQIGGIKSAEKQSENRRSKNEIYFYQLCEKHFNSVDANLNMFNGWDADVIIHDFKIAILWNGVWHYKKITKEHSVKQVQNRDKIKIKEIEKSGYIPYIIKDMGKCNKLFVEKQFELFLKYLDKK
jgi:hypothetical protein